MVQVEPNKSVEFINKLYGNLTYFDEYGTSVIIVAIISLFVFCVFSYCIVSQEKEKIAADWANQRCNPKNIPFAGWISKPDGKTAFEYTGENFNYCVQNILITITGYMLQPFNYLLSVLTDEFNELEENINSSRGIMANLRDRVKDVFKNILNRILNVVIPIQKIFIALMDTINKTQGILTSGLFTMLGSYLTLQTLLGAILELIVKILIALVAVIVGLWAVPVTWPAAASLSAVFLAISIPMSIIVIFMSEVMHIKSSAIPSLRCFDGNTIIELENNNRSRISNIKVGDVLKNGDVVTGTMKLTSSRVNMYIVNGVAVSEYHHMLHGDDWICAKNHPQAIVLSGYSRTHEYIYCLNTTSKTIHINGMTFADWDELYGDILYDTVLTVNIKHPDDNHTITKCNLHKYIDVGFSKKTSVDCAFGEVDMCDIDIMDVTNNGGIVYGIVHLENERMSILTSNGVFTSNNMTFGDYNDFLNKIHTDTYNECTSFSSFQQNR